MIKNKKIVTFLCILVFVLTASIAGEAALTVKHSGSKIPTTIKVGDFYKIAGKVNANGKLSKAVVTIYDAAGKKCLQKYTKNLSGNSFDIADADPHIYFNKLKAGEYHYRVSVYDASKKKYRVIDSKFRVGDKPAEKEGITGKNIAEPKKLEKGKKFKMSGTVSSAKTISKVVLTIYDSKGDKCLQRYTANVNAKTYKVSKANSYLPFEKLEAGDYFYRIAAYDASGKKTRITNVKFTVIAPTSIKISGAAPSADVTIVKGKTYEIAGTITSANVMQNVTAKILNSDGKLVFGKGVDPKGRTYNLKKSALSQAMSFEKLSAGTYKYQILAKDSNNKIVKLVDRKVTVKEKEVPTNTEKDIQLIYGKPSADITISAGATYDLGGIIVSKNTLNNVTLVIKNASKAVVVRKTVNPKARTYLVEKSALDKAAAFETFKKGTYTIQISAKDAKGKSAVLLNKKVVIK